MENINNDFDVRLALLRETGYNVEVAQKCLDFVRGVNEVKKQEPSSDRLADGVYLIDTKGNAVRYIGEDTETVNDTAYIGVVQGSHSVAISLYDASKKEITLTAKENDKKHGGYKNKYTDAVQDWDGEANTERLKQIGLNPAIQLKDGEYIPSLAEMYLISLNLKVINAAIRFVGGEYISDCCWSSTEYSATSAWFLNLHNGGACVANNAMNNRRVRPVSPFVQRTKNA